MMNYHYNVYKELADARMKDLQKITFEQKRYAKVKRRSPVKKKGAFHVSKSWWTKK
ncbi:hypothetical protein [Virgibacillus profundi]|uniref:hypothetical protein n=1 Tax=Virgibacillus profundi TaxID=2024555 RepID=UPI0013FDDF55|nr:hypothetical protein [Virgibacillus profundi]